MSDKRFVPGAHAQVDPTLIAQRTATRQVEQRNEIDGEIKPAIMRLETDVASIRAGNLRMEAKLDLALRPRPIHPIVQGTVFVAALLWTLFLGSIAYTFVRGVAPSHTAPLPVIAEASHR